MFGIEIIKIQGKKKKKEDEMQRKNRQKIQSQNSMVLPSQMISFGGIPHP